MEIILKIFIRIFFSLLNVIISFSLYNVLAIVYVKFFKSYTKVNFFQYKLIVFYGILLMIYFALGFIFKFKLRWFLYLIASIIFTCVVFIDHPFRLVLILLCNIFSLSIFYMLDLKYHKATQ